MKIKKKHFIYLAALILPFGLIALAAWTAYEQLTKKAEEDEKRHD